MSADDRSAQRSALIPTKKVSVRLRERAYEIQIGSGLLGQTSRLLDSFSSDLIGATHFVVVTDQNVLAPHAQNVLANLARTARTDTITIEPGEASKSVQGADRIWQQMLQFGADRKTVVVAVGGGVVGDLGGFIAATYARGVPLLQIPTTLLAQVDSSVGGKVGVNLPTAKNMVGAFWQPHGVIIDIDTLQTLPQRDYRAGLAEVVKYGVIMDEAFFNYLQQHVEKIRQRDPATLQSIVSKCCRLKADVVEEDERETTGRRAILNYGHTFCHAIEAVSGYGEFLHGEAVAIGMLCASRLAVALNRIPQSVTDQQYELLTQLGLPTDVPDISRDELIGAMSRDKKSEHGKLRFVLPDRIGNVELVGDVQEDLVREAWDG